METYSIKLTLKQFEALEVSDAESWFGFYEQYESPQPDEIKDYCWDNDCTEDEMRMHVEQAAASSIEDDCLTLVAGSPIESDIVHSLESLLAPFACTPTGLKRAAQTLLEKIFAASPAAIPTPFTN